MAGRRRVAWTRGALRELGDAVEYLAEDSTATALRFLEGALRAARSLEHFPRRGRTVPEVADPALRELLVGRYRLMYLVRSDAVEILAFVHGARSARG